MKGKGLVLAAPDKESNSNLTYNSLHETCETDNGTLSVSDETGP